MASRLRAIYGHNAADCFVSQRLFLHVAQVAGTRGVARLAPACPTAHAVVVIHPRTGPTACTGMAHITVHARAVEKLYFRYVIGGFGQRPFGSDAGIAAVVTRLAS